MKNTLTLLVLVLLNIHLNKGDVVHAVTGGKNIGDTLTITYTITPSFTSAIVSQEGTTRSTCVPSSCFPSTYGNISFAPIGTGIAVEFQPVDSSHEGKWQCDNSDGTSSIYTFIPILISILVVLAVLSIELVMVYDVIGLLISNGLVAQGFLHYLRYYNRRKGIIPVSPKTLLAKRGDKVVLEIERLQIIDFNCQRCPGGKLEPDFINGEDKLSFTKPIITDDDYGVYQVDILIDCSQKQSDAKYNNYVIPNSATRTDDQIGRDCTFLVKFQWDKEDLVSIQHPAAYFFADKYFLNGVKFTGIQIIIGAAISQCIALIAVSIVLLVVYFGYKKYDICIGIAVSCALAIAFSLLGFLLYLLTVVFICRRKLKSKGGKGQTRCGRKCLLFVMLPVALLVLIGIFIVKKCRGGKDECGNGEQGTKEEISINSPNQKAD